jgi:hypothetical protein
MYMITIECFTSITTIAILSLLDNKKVEFRTHYRKRGGTEKLYELEKLNLINYEKN